MSWGVIQTVSTDDFGWYRGGDAAPISSDSFVIMGQITDGNVGVARIDSSGSVVWQTENIIGGVGSMGVAYNPDSGVIFASSYDGSYFGTNTTVGLDEDGNQLWTVETGTNSCQLAKPAPDGGAFIGEADGLHEVTPDGNSPRSFQTSVEVNSVQYVPESDSIYVGSRDNGTVTRLNRLFGQENQVELESGVQTVTFAHYIDGEVYAILDEPTNGSINHSLYTLDSDLTGAEGVGPVHEYESSVLLKDRIYGGFNDTWWELDKTDGSKKTTVATAQSRMGVGLEGDDKYVVAAGGYSTSAFFETDVNVGFEVGGSVKNTDGNGIEGVTVETVSGSSSTTTGSNGDYAVFEKDGDYTLEASSSGYFSEQQNVSVAGASETVDFTLEPSDLSGTVTDVSGATLDTVDVELVQNGTVVSTVSPTNGEYTFSGDLDADTDYTVRINDSSGDYFEDETSVSVARSEVTGVDFELDTFIELSVAARDVDVGKPAQSVQVQVVEETRARSSQATGSDGVASVATGTRFSSPVTLEVAKSDRRYDMAVVDVDLTGGDQSFDVELSRKSNIGTAI